MSLLEVHDLSITYPNGTWAVRGVTFSLHEGRCLALVGESGSGKTSVVLAILGLLPAGTHVAGSITLDGEELVGLPPERHRALRGTRVGLVPQDPFAACDPLRPVADHVAEAWRAQGRQATESAVASLLGEVGLDAHRAAQRPHQWSGGMLQRATIAAATALSPELVVADEPTSALDADLREEILALLRRRSRSLLLVTHDLRVVADHAEHTVVLYAGRVVESGPTATVLGHPRHPFTRALAAATPGRVDPAHPTAR